MIYYDIRDNPPSGPPPVIIPDPGWAEAWERFKEKFKEKLNPPEPVPQPIPQPSLFEKAWNWIKGPAWSWIKQAASDTWAWIKQAASDIGNWISDNIFVILIVVGVIIIIIGIFTLQPEIIGLGGLLCGAGA